MIQPKKEIECWVSGYIIMYGETLWCERSNKIGSQIDKLRGVI